MTSDNSPNGSPSPVSSGKDRSDGAASGHGRRKPWTAPHLITAEATNFGAAPTANPSVMDGTTQYSY